jgi:hypothetical protein
MQNQDWLAEYAKARSRCSWNDRLAHWEKPASDSEEATIERAANMVRNVMARNEWFVGEGVQIAAQGSYYNNTNVRKEADMDLRAVHHGIYVEYAPGVNTAMAYQALAYSPTGRTFTTLADQMRREIARELRNRFDWHKVDDSGAKAIRLKGAMGSRAELDIVPCFKLHHIWFEPITRQYIPVEGVAILSKGGSWTLNYPNQHHDNGVAKRGRTQHRFKKVVRMLKTLRDELVHDGVLDKGTIPSFLIECLVYRVEDPFFLIETDDRYDRLLRIVRRMHELLSDATWWLTAKEINEVKSLFGNHQAWTLDGARRFSAAAWNRLMASS